MCSELTSSNIVVHVLRLASRLDKDGYLILPDPEAGRGVKVMNMQRLYDPDTAEVLAPAYINADEGVAEAELTDMRSRTVSLDAIAQINWAAELHLLCLSIKPVYRQLWNR